MSDERTTDLADLLAAFAAAGFPLVPDTVDQYVALTGHECVSIQLANIADWFRLVNAVRDYGRLHPLPNGYEHRVHGLDLGGELLPWATQVTRRSPNGQSISLEVELPEQDAPTLAHALRRLASLPANQGGYQH
ncbi:hypothetical protein ABT255_02095 [Streptomyces mirabilis]|uniref:hypothetical protein n=1 Tax=Streptomyces mirabilis TaxID=68239 RepID=UPI0033329786